MLITTGNKKIKYLSWSAPGKTHDFSFFKQLFPPIYRWFERFNIKIDSGFLGFLKNYVCKSLQIPYKNSKNHKLSKEEKQFNRDLSSKMIVVENSISGMKRYRVLSDRLRLHDIDLYNEIIGVCAGLWNFYLSMNH